MQRVVTKQRLDRGLWTDASRHPCERGFIVVGGLMLVWGCTQHTWYEGVLLYHQTELQEDVDAVVEVPCDGDAMMQQAVSHLMHLQNCSMTGEQVINPAAPPVGLEALTPFRENLPATLTCAWFKMQTSVYQCLGGNGCSPAWVETSESYSIRTVNYVSTTLRIGNFPVGEEIASRLPGSPVAVRESVGYARLRLREDGSLIDELEDGQALTLVLNSTNMQTHPRLPGALCSNGEKEPRINDAKVVFTCGNAPSASVLATMRFGQLAPWRSSHRDENVSEILGISATAADLLATRRERYESEHLSRHLLALLWNIFGMWCFAFSNHAHSFCKGYCNITGAKVKGVKPLSEMCCSLARASLLSLVPSVAAYGAGWLGFRYPMALWISCAIALPVLGLLTLYTRQEDDDDDVEEQDSDENLVLSSGDDMPRHTKSFAQESVHLGLSGAFIAVSVALVVSVVLAIRFSS